ncbi:MAG: type II toxin-antitoxin system HicB family antitoxin [Moorellales bacterium]
MTKDRYVYPAVFTFDPDGVSVEFPDLPGCLTCGSDVYEAAEMAREALALHLYGMEEDGDPIPPPSPPAGLKVGANQAIMLVEAWMPPVRSEIQNRAVKKTLTIPKWLNDLAESRKVNFSQVLQEALKQHLGVDGPAART